MSLYSLVEARILTEVTYIGAKAWANVMLLTAVA
jgi:hypothetical protein